MKRSLILAASLLAATFLSTPFAQAQQRPSMYGEKVKADVKIRYVYSLEEALTRAKAEGKPIFFHSFADWAMPCHSMNMYVFADPNFGAWLEKHFVPLFIDVTEPNHKPIAAKYGIRSFAHYLVLDAEGRIIQRIVGGKPLPDFQNDVALALSPKTSLAGTEARYKNGKQSLKDLRAYLTALHLADEREKALQVGTQILGKLKPKDYYRAENWPIISRLVGDSNSELFKHIADNKAQYVKNVGQEKVNRLGERLFYAPIAEMAAGKEAYNAEQMLDLYLDMQRFQLPDTSICYRMYEVAKLRGEHKYDELISLLEDRGHKLGHEEVALALTLELPEMSTSQKHRLIAYLRKLAAAQEGGSGKHLTALANQLSQEGGLDLINNGSLEQALAQAKAEGKLVFLDAYTTWCGPCKQMAKNVFPRPEVGRALNPRYVSLKIDMEKGEGPELLKRYDIKGFPTMLVLDTEGRVLKKLVGAREAQQLIEELTTQMPATEWSYPLVKEAYERGERTGNVLHHYTQQAIAAADLSPEKAQSIMQQWYDSLTDKDFCAPSSWEYVAAQLQHPSPAYDRAVRLYKELCQQNGADRVDEAFAQGLNQMLKQKPGSKELDSLKQILTQLERLPKNRPTLKKARLVLQSYIAEISAL